MSYSFEWTLGPAVIGALLLILLVPGFALIALVVVALAALAALVALAGAIVAAPYLLVRTVRRRVAERHESSDPSVPMATAIAQTATATNR
jgi:preprotein translocase subunit SecF